MFSATGQDGKTDFFEQEGNAIILSAIGARCGKCFKASGQWTAIKNTIVIKNNEKILLNYLYEYINNENYWLRSGKTQPFITLTSAKSQKLPLPPLDIQQKIVDEIEEVEHNNIELKMQADKIYEEMQTVISNVYSKYKLEKLGKYTEPPQYGANVKAIDGNPGADYRYIRITDIDNNGNLLSDWKTAEQIEDKYILNEGDFLFARSGATAGKTFYYTKQKCEKAIFAGYLIRFKCKKELNSRFLDILCKSDIYKKWAENIRGGAAQPNINAQQFASYVIPVPTLAEQQKIISKIEELEKQINKAQTIIDNSKNKKQAILDKYLK